MSTKLVKTENVAITTTIEEKKAAGQLEIVRQYLAKDATPEQFNYFMAVCRSVGLDPLKRQIYAVLRNNNKTGKKDLSIQIGIDGARAVAADSGFYDGVTVEWCGSDGVWMDAWLSNDNPPAAAKATAYRIGSPHPFTHVCRTADYKPKFDQMGLWDRMVCTMIGKCATMGVLRAAFPAQLSGLYIKEEMQQAADEGELMDYHSKPDGDEIEALREIFVAKTIEVGLPEEQIRQWCLDNVSSELSDKWTTFYWDKAINLLDHYHHD